MLHFLDPFRDFTLASVALRMLLTVLCGGLIGIERAFKRRSAGFRTHILICLGAAMTTMTSLYLVLVMHYYTDLARLGAQVIAGIGFIGAGTIIVTRRHRVKGLTTAAGLWVTASMGIAIGAGLPGPALICFVLILITNYYMHYMTRYVEDHTRTMELYVELERSAVPELIDFIKDKSGYRIDSMERRSEEPIVDGDIILRMEIDMRRRIKHSIIINDVLDIDGVHYAEEITS